MGNEWKRGATSGALCELFPAFKIFHSILEFSICQHSAGSDDTEFII